MPEKLLQEHAAEHSVQNRWPRCGDFFVNPSNAYRPLPIVIAASCMRCTGGLR